MSVAAQRALATWPLLAAQVMLLGTTFFALAVAAPVDSDAHQPAFTPLWRVLSLTALLAAPLVLLVNTASMANSNLMTALQFVPDVIRETHFGHVWACDFAIITALFIVVIIRPHHRITTAVLAFLTAATLLLSAISSHAIDHGVVAVICYFIHEVAAALWIGAVLGLWLGVVRGHFGAEWVGSTAPRVSRLAQWTVVILILSGLYTAWYALDGDPRRLIYAAYGRVLMVKIIAATMVLMIGGFNRFFLLPTLAKTSSRTALLRNVGVESLLLLGVLGLAALLANTPPAH